MPFAHKDGSAETLKSWIWKKLLQPKRRAISLTGKARYLSLTSQ